MANSRLEELIDAELQQRTGEGQPDIETSVTVLGRGPRMGRDSPANRSKVVQTFVITGKRATGRGPHDCNEKSAGSAGFQESG